MFGSALQTIARSPLVERPKRFGLALIDRMDRALAGPRQWGGAIAGLIGLQLALILLHRPWLDEVQALLIALQSPTLADLLANLRYEGHPALWYLILRGLGLILDPRWVLPAAVALPALSAQLCVLLRSPLSRAERLLLASGEILLFEFFTVSRGASLGVCLIILALVLWRSRWAWLAIALLPLCDFLFGAISLVLIALRARERRLWWPGLGLWALCGVCAAWTVRPAPDIVPALEAKGPLLDTANVFLRLGGLLVPLQTDGLWPRWDGDPPLALGLVFGIAFIGFAWHETRHDRLHRALLFAFLALTVVFSALVYPLPVRHLMLVAVLLIALVWRAAADGTPLTDGIRLWLLAASLCGLLVAAIGLAVPFDTADRAAREIEKRGLTSQPWLAFPDASGLGVPIHLRNGMEFERPERRCRQSFVRWNLRSAIRTPDQLIAYLRAESAGHGGFYLLSKYELGGAPRDLVQPLAAIPPGYDGVGYHLYRIAPGQPVMRTAAAPCVAPLRPLSSARIR